MKKIVILLFIVFTTVNSAFFGQKTVSASAVIDNKEYWSIKELLEYEPTAIALHDSTCGDDNDCKIKIYYEQDDYHVGGIYSAFINSYNHTYSSDRYSLTLTAPSGRTLLIKSKAL